MSLAETMLATLLKTVDFDKLIQAPQIQDAFANIKEIRDDFKVMRARLEYLERHMKDAGVISDDVGNNHEGTNANE